MTKSRPGSREKRSFFVCMALDWFINSYFHYFIIFWNRNRTKWFVPGNIFNLDLKKCYFLTLWTVRLASIKSLLKTYLFHKPFCPFVPGAEQEEDPEGDGACPDDPAGRVHTGHGAQAAADASEAAHWAHAAAAPDGARKPGGVQRPAAARTTQETHPGAAAAAQKPQGAWNFHPTWLFSEFISSKRKFKKF